MRFGLKNRKMEAKKKKENQRRGKKEKKNMSEARTLLFKLKPGHLLLSKAFCLSLEDVGFLIESLKYIQLICHIDVFP